MTGFSWKGLLTALLLVIVATLLGWWWFEHRQEAGRDDSIQRAWDVRRGDQLSEALLADPEPSAPLDQARADFLAGRFNLCLAALAEVGEEGDRLRSEAEKALLFEVAWPSRVVASVRIDLRRDGRNELVRVVDPGTGFPPRDQELQVLSWRQKGYLPATLEFRRPDGSLIEEREIQKAERFEELDMGAGLFCDGGLWVVTAGPQAFQAYRFRSDKPVEVDGAEVVTRAGRWRWEQDRFRAIADPEE